LLCTHLHRHVCLTRKTKGRCLGTFENRDAIDRKELSRFGCLGIGRQAGSLRHDPRSVPCRSVWDLQWTVALGQVSLRMLLFPPVSIIPPMLYTPLRLETSLTKKKSGRRL
jgi:hypothetical protein